MPTSSPPHAAHPRRTRARRGAAGEADRRRRVDVWDKQPPAADHPLLQFDNVIASPHTAGVTREARANMGKIAAQQMIVTLDGKRPPRIVNPQVWPAYSKRFKQTFGLPPEG